MLVRRPSALNDPASGLFVPCLSESRAASGVSLVAFGDVEDCAQLASAARTRAPKGELAPSFARHCARDSLSSDSRLAAGGSRTTLSAASAAAGRAYAAAVR